MASDDLTVQALVLIDLQNAFFEDPELARCRDDLVDHCNALVGAARRAGALVVSVRTVHRRDRSTWSLNMLEDDQGMAFEDDDSSSLVPGFDAEGAVDVVKTRDSAFHDTELDRLLREHGVRAFALAGVSTESCISATAVDAYAHDLRVVLVDRATASVDTDLHEQTLQRLRDQYRQPTLQPGEVRFSGQSPS